MPSPASLVSFPSDVAARVRALLRRPSELEGEALTTVLDACAVVAPHVPDARRGDWDKLMVGFRAQEPEGRRRLRVEALVRAIELVELAANGHTLLERPLAAFHGIGRAHEDALRERGLVTARDLLWRLPVGFDDRTTPRTIGDAKAHPDVRMVIAASVKSASALSFRGRRGVRVVVQDAGGVLVLMWFYPAQHVLALCKPAAPLLVVGRTVVKDGKPASMFHPELVLDTPEARVLRPRYTRTGVPEAVLGRIRAAVCSALAALPEEAGVRAHIDPVPAQFDDALVTSLPGDTHGSGALAALGAVHAIYTQSPQATQIVPGAPPNARAAHAVLEERFMFAEAYQLIRARLVAESERGDAPKLARSKHVEKRLAQELGFALTAGQARVVPEILADLAKTNPMRRLLLGDVGTGKTAVAMFALATCVDRGYQAAVLAPTTVLAEQYLEALAPLARATSASIVLLTGQDGAKERARVTAGLASGKLSIVVGTHALFSADVTFAKLGLVVVDEQQRLGVAQRLALVRKGHAPHMLSLTATPIPRTLALAIRGHVATSTLDERPRGRTPAKTRVMAMSALDEVIDEVRATCDRGEQVFFITPTIDPESDGSEGDGAASKSAEKLAETDAVGAELRAQMLAAHLGEHAVGLVHGRMHARDMTRVMREFRSGALRVLVATTVVEVGVDVPNATLMVIERAERYGLSQLHQLRGRVGRGSRPGTCLLLHEDEAGPRAHERLAALVQHDKGSDVARIDLQLRGPGDLWGTRQWGEEEGVSALESGAPPPWLPALETWVRAHLEASATAASASAPKKNEKIAKKAKVVPPVKAAAKSAKAEKGAPPNEFAALPAALVALAARFADRMSQRGEAG